MDFVQVITKRINALIKERGKGNEISEQIDPYWTDIQGGYVPKYLTKDKTAPGSNRDYARSTWGNERMHSTKGLGTGGALGYGIREYKSTDKGAPTNTSMTKLLKGNCKLCDSTWFVPADRELDYFSCPKCMSSENYERLKILFYERDDGFAFHKCPSCGVHGNIHIKRSQDKFQFQCRKCDRLLILKRENPIELVPYSDVEGLFGCGFCGRIFKSTVEEEEPVICTRCGASGPTR